jgi:hypothetical protein
MEERTERRKERLVKERAKARYQSRVRKVSKGRKGKKEGKEWREG